MQKMTNILLANKENTSDNLSVGGIKQGDKSRTQSSDNSDFSLALEQASTQAKESNRAKNVNVETRSAKDGPKPTGSGDESEREAKVGDKEVDVNHVLAQINWASKLEGSASLDNSGDTLPLEGNEKATSDARLDDDVLSLVNDAAEEVIAGDVAIEPSQPGSLIDIEKLAIDADIQLSNPDTQLLDPNTQLPLDKNLIDKLVQESGLSEAELTEYSPENLIQLIATVTSSEFQAGNVRSAAVVSSRGGSESRSAGLTQANNTLPLSEAETSDKSSGVKDVAKVTQSQQAAGLDVLTRTESQIEQGKDKQFSSILGEKTQLEQASKLPAEVTAKAEQQLKGAELSVQLNPSKANLEASSTLMDTTSTSNVDIKTLAGMQIGSTPQSKTDTPQFQLLSRQNNDTQSQMQEMIQRFSPVMKQQLVTMVSQGTLHAEIRLDPPELGPLVVRIQVQGDQTQVQFHVVQPQTRDIVEQALPRLREMLAEQGLQLTDSQVSQQDSGKDQGEAEHSERSQEGYDVELDEISADESLLSLNQASSYRSAIDYYA
ncbi:flagellar hook-length control protein FliK [Shewanella benthica]|uniref:flagellar hook-length control protein FliK n=1 Tax=Shewanella benthica TaxID=43661 RepID=UPI001D0CFC7B|nr:flagellar hook-length control protein FliK [Shewanella benthica]MCL1061782.1 flagellar hook-length control protein FliK [Shewanella benthica]